MQFLKIYFYCIMKKLVWLSFAILLLASACTSYTCPTYAKQDTQEQSAKQSEQKIWFPAF